MLWCLLAFAAWLLIAFLAWSLCAMSSRFSRAEEERDALDNSPKL
jgi:hypothetical protein